MGKGERAEALGEWFGMFWYGVGVYGLLLGVDKVRLQDIADLDRLKGSETDSRFHVSTGRSWKL